MNEPTEAATTWAAQLWCLPENEHREMDAEFAMSIARRLDETWADALRWCSGSADFNPSGVARKGWEKIAHPLLNPGEPPTS